MSKQSKDKIVELRDEFDKKRVRQNFIKYLYEQGHLNQFANIMDLDKAAQGKISNKFTVHHVVPLSYGGSNDFSNLILVEKKLHNNLHKFIYDAYLSGKQVGEEFLLSIPEFTLVSFYSDYKIILNEYIDKFNKYVTTNNGLK